MEAKIIKRKIFFTCLVLLFVFFAVWKLNKQVENVESKVTEKTYKKFIPEGVSPGNFSKYDITLTMNRDEEFQLESTVIIKNISTDHWENLIFYFIPNMFTKDVSPDLEHPATVDFHTISINGEKANYTLDKDTLNIPLVKKLEPNEEIRVDFSYDLTLPEKGLRFTKSNDNFHLAQFYPMVATYRDHQWNKEEYRFRGETYHTAFSDFKLTYDIPKEYTLASSFDREVFPSANKSSYEIENVKEIFLAILKDPILVEKEGDISVRVFGFQEGMEELYKELGEEASAALDYFQEIIGPYPFKQLDIVIDGLGMEYPGIVTAHTTYHSEPLDPERLKSTVIHEIAHQWFYGMVSNDPYYDAWLDEGFASFAPDLYHYSKSKQSVPYELKYQRVEHLDLPVNLPLDLYEPDGTSYVYGKSSAMLWRMFEKKGGVKEAEKFFKAYYQFYKYKEINSKEFVRFTKYYFDLEDDSIFQNWLLMSNPIHEPITKDLK